MTSPHTSSESASSDPPGSSNNSPLSSTSPNNPTANSNSVNLRPAADRSSQTTYWVRGGHAAVTSNNKRGNVLRGQNTIRNPAGRAPLADPFVREPIRTQGNVSNRKRPSAAMRIVDSSDWTSWDELRIKIFELPSAITIQDLLSSFRAEGNVNFIDLCDDHASDGTRNAFLSFRPPPARPFWNQRFYPLKFGNQKVATCRFGYPGCSQRSLYPSPVQANVSYPERITLKAESLDFGFLIDENTMLGMKRVVSIVNAPIQLELNVKHKEILAFFRLHITDWRTEKPGNRLPEMGALNREEDFKFRIGLSEVTEIGESPLELDQFAMIIQPMSPPSFFKRIEDVPASGLLRTWTDRDAWYRQTDVVYSPNRLKKLPLTLKKSHVVLDLGRWTTYRLIFSRSKNDMGVYQKMLNALQDYNVKVVPRLNLQITTDKKPSIWEHIDRPLDQRIDGRTALQELVAHQFSHISFPVRYQLEVCISLGCFNEYNLSLEFVEKLAAMKSKNAQDLLEVIALEKKQIFRPTSIFDSKSMSGVTSSAKIPHYCVLVRSATVTPTTIRFHTPSIETSNRVIRQYSEYADRFLRVRFRDEQTEAKIFSTNKDIMNEMFTRIKRTLSNGIQIGDRRYEFLCWGNSQLREHSAYFFAPTAHIDARRIRMWMGSFEGIKIVAKYASRLGQCFSTTRAITGIAPCIKEMDDINHYGHCFTDGVGKISPFLAQLAASELGIYSQETPSVFQFRLGGCKGVLTVSPTSAAMDLHLRPSQYKFPASHEGLEVIRWSQYICARLNRQLILVLSTLGVGDGIFRLKMERQLQDLGEAMTNSTKALALLQKYVDHNQMTLTIASMVIDGFQQSQEPFMLALLHLWKAWSLKYLKEKAQIAVDGGALLLGCVDEENELRGHYEEMHRRMPGPEAPLEDRARFLPQIFVQLSRDHNGNESSKPRVILGPVLLTRSPMLHPGDVRVVCCVDIPKLHHIKDAVVLPQNGDRDLASMCSGGDLDGDDFMVIWDPDLLPKEWNSEPMDYSPLPPLIHGREITVDDMTTFFVTYMKNDSLGAIATSHVALADQSDYGVKDEKCLQLAELHSQAVDFAKTGQPAIMTQDLRPRRKPHFQLDHRDQGNNKGYHSKKILGQLYDQVKMTGFSPKVSGPFDSRILDAFEIPNTTLIAAKNLKKEYDAAVRRIMAKYDIKSEFEVWSTFVLAHNWSKDFKFHEEIGQVSAAMKAQFREKAAEIAGGRDFDQLAIFAAAMYQVTAQETALIQTMNSQKHPGSQKEKCEETFISFPWLFHDVLGKLMKNTSSTGASVGALHEEHVQLLTQKQKSHKGRNLANTSGQILDLETQQGTIHPGDLFKPFASQYMKDLEGLGGQDNSPILSTPESENLNRDERRIPTAYASPPTLGPSIWQQPKTSENSVGILDFDPLNTSSSAESEELDDVEEIVLDCGAHRSSGQLLEAFTAEE